MHSDDALQTSLEQPGHEPIAFKIATKVKVLALAAALLITITKIPRLQNLWQFPNDPSFFLSGPAMSVAFSLALTWLLYVLITRHGLTGPFNEENVRNAKALAIVSTIGVGALIFPSVVGLFSRFSFTDLLHFSVNFCSFLTTPLMCFGAYYAIRGHVEFRFGAPTLLSFSRAKSCAIATVVAISLHVLGNIILWLIHLSVKDLFNLAGMSSLLLLFASAAFPALVAMSIYAAATPPTDLHKFRNYAHAAISVAVASALLSIVASYINAMNLAEFRELYAAFSLELLVSAIGTVLMGIAMVSVVTPALQRSNQRITTASGAEESPL